jgi:hypothetical protein
MISTCPKFSEDHLLYICPYFRELRVQARRELVTEKGLCGNCLRTGHLATQIKTLLQMSAKSSHYAASRNITSFVNTATSASFVNNHVRMNQTLLSTVLLFISDSNNVPQLCRAVLDSGEQERLIT